MASFSFSVEQFDNILHNLDMGIVVEFCCGSGSSGYSGEIDAGILGGAGIDIAVAGIKHLIRGNLEMFQGLSDALWRRFVSRDIITADDAVNQVWDTIGIKLFLDAVTGLAGDNANSGPLFAQCPEGSECMGEEVRAGSHVTIGFLFVDFEEFAGGCLILGLDDLLDGIHHGEPDGTADSIILALRSVGFIECDMETFEDG